MIDPLQADLAALYAAALKDPTSSRGVPFRIVDAMLQRIIELEHRLAPREPHPTFVYPLGNEAIGYVATAIRRAAELSVDHILAWHGQGTSSSMAKSMTEEIERNMLKALNL